MSRSARPTIKAPFSARPRGMLGLATMALIWEKLWPRVWGLLAVLLVFFSVALFDLLPSLPKPVHWLFLIGFAAIFFLRLAAFFAANYKIDPAHSRARLERDSQLAHQPLLMLEERHIGEGRDILAESLWEAHRHRMSGALKNLNVRLPSPGLSMRDPYAIRMLVILVCFVAVGVGGHDVPERLVRAIVPQTKNINLAGLKVDVWVTPPAYTGLAPVFLEQSRSPGKAPEPVEENNKRQPVKIPVGSFILAQVTGGAGRPVIDLAARRVELKPINEAQADGGYRGEIQILNADHRSSRLAILIDTHEIADWPIQVLVDRSPQVEFIAPPKRHGQASLALRFEARDDFALKQVWATIRNPEGLMVPGGDDHIRFELPAAGLGSTLSTGRGVRDFSSHPWAGTPVNVRLYALDAKDQEGKSESFSMVLPARVFNHPVARALVDIRKQLNTPGRAIFPRAISSLDQINSNPAHFFHDTTVFLNIAVARARLAHASGAVRDGNNNRVASVQKQLWATALRIEDGEFSVADKELRDVQEQINQAMRDGAPAVELERLMDELQMALDKYLAALAEHLERQGVSEMPMAPSTRAMESGDLQRMIDMARKLSQTGATDAAQKMLAQLNKMLDGIRDGARMAPPNSKMGKTRKTMEELRALAQRQQQLLDQTFREMQKQETREQLPKVGNGAMPPPTPGRGGENSPNAGKPSDQTTGARQKPGSGQLQDMAGTQAELRRELGRLMMQMDEILGSIPPALGQAERAMKGARGSLNKNDAGAAVPQQTEALEKMRQGTGDAAEQLAKRMQGRNGMVPGLPGQRAGPGRDPFGRPGGRSSGIMADDGNVKIPSEREMIRAREILDELHRRAGERSRPQPERDFIDRLLRRF